ncbi:MAG: hypothetical protein IJS37_03615 [Bacilli bacterium]|nr:hypothetical protein [Bacilli bacterium]
MKKSVLVLAAAALACAGCGFTDASSTWGQSSQSSRTTSQSNGTSSQGGTSSASSQKPTESSQTPVISSQQDSEQESQDQSAEPGSEPAYESSAEGEPSQESSVPYEESSTAPSEPIVSDWTVEEKAIIKDILRGLELPSFGIHDYEFEAGEDYFEAYGIVDEYDLEGIGATLEGLGLAVDLDEEYGEIVATGFFEDWSYDYIYVGLEEGEDEIVIDIYGAYFESMPDWPSEYILEDAEYTGVTEEIPAFEGAEAYVYYLGSYYGLINYSAIECYGEGINEQTALDYLGTLEGAGYTFDEDFGAYVKGDTYVGIGVTENCLSIMAFGLSGEEESSETSSSEHNVGWSEEEEAFIAKTLRGIELPSFGIHDYEFEAGEDYFEAIGYIDTLDVEEMAGALEELGFAVTIDETYGDIEGYAFGDDWSYAYLYINFEEADEGFTVDIYGAYFESMPDWPSAKILEDAEYTGVSEEIPAYEGAEAYVYYIGSYFGLMYYSAVECYGDDITEQTALDYAGILEGAGFIYDEEYYCYVKGTTYVEVYVQDKCMSVMAYGYSEEEEGEWGDKWVFPEAGEGIFSFFDESLLTTKDAAESVWTAGNSTFTVSKGTSTVDVGNIGSGKEFFSNPLRTYKNQVITIQSETPMSYVEFYVVEDEKSSVENLGYTEPSVGEWFVDEEAQTVILTFEEPVTEVSITLTEGQVRLYCAAITFAE